MSDPGPVRKDIDVRTFIPETEASHRAAIATSAAPLGQDGVQRILGNQAVQRILQAKPEVSEPGDSYEQEADSVAEQVMRTPGTQLQRACSCGAGCAECPGEQPGREPASLPARHVQEGDPGQTTAPPLVDNVLRSSGRPLDPAIRAFMEPRFGHDFSGVRVHTDPAAERSARDVHANAYTVGRDIVFGVGQFAPQTQPGQRLIAHELTHVVQQSQAPSNTIQRQPAQYFKRGEDEVTESIIEALQQSNNIAGLNVDPVFEILNPYPLPFQVRVLTHLYERKYFHGLLGYLAPGTRANHSLVVAVRLVECQKEPSLLTYEEILETQAFLGNDVALPAEFNPIAERLDRERMQHEERRAEQRRQRRLREDDKRFAEFFDPAAESCRLKKGVMRWLMYPATPSDGKGMKQRMQITFLPDPPYRNKPVTFLQTLREEGAGSRETTLDIGKDSSTVYSPFYGTGWNYDTKRLGPTNEGRYYKDIYLGFRSQPSSADDPTAYMFDEPYFFPPPHGRVFESVAVVLETGEILGALTWGVGKVPTYAEKPKCADQPSAEFHGTLERFYTPKNPAPASGRENYDLILDGFAPNATTLTADQKKQLDSIGARVRERIGDKGPAETTGQLVVGGFGDSADTDPLAMSGRRAQAVADYLIGQGVPADTLNLRAFGATWARHEVSTKAAGEGRNRRIQIRLFPKPNPRAED